MSLDSPVSARVSRTFAASAQRVFDAWLDPALIGRWMFGPLLREEEVLRIALNAAVGGTFSFLVRRQGTEIDHLGTYLEIDRPRRLAFTWRTDDTEEDSRVVVEVTPAGDGCEVTLTHELAPEWADYVSSCETAWNKMLGALAVVLGE